MYANISKLKKPILIVVVALLFLLFLNPFKIISAGHRGVVLNLGKVSEEVLGEGLQFRTPFIQTIVEINVQVLKTEAKSESATKDLQMVMTEIALNYSLVPEAVNKLYQEIGLDYEYKIISPAIAEVVKAVTAQYTASEIITRREEVSRTIKNMLQERLAPYHIRVHEVAMKDFSFSKTFEESIEAKQKAEQDALRAKNELERIKIEAEQQVAQARAEAEALRLKSQQVTPLMVELERIKKWDGKYPTVVTGNSIPMLNIK